MSEPKVTVVIPTYNQAGLLREALASVLSQTRTDWEAVVIDNHSDDDTEAAVASFADPRIAYLKFRNEGVIGASRNRGIERARGEWVAFLDSDDVWLPEKLERCLAAAGDEVDVIAHALHFVRDGAVVRRHRSGPLNKATFRHMLFNGPVLTPSAVLVRTSVLRELGGFDERADFATAEDFELWLRLTTHGCRFVILDEVLARYRLHDANQSRSVYRHMNASLAVIDHHFAALGETGLLGRLALRRVKALYHYGAARRLETLNQRREAVIHYATSLRLFPALPRVYAALVLGLLSGRGKG